jgi:ribonuclease HII
MVMVMGIDDAGRGPIIGPMVLAGVLIDKDNEDKLKEWGAKDSKLLLQKKRIEIRNKVVKEFETHFEVIYPEEIDARDVAKTNLNWIEAVRAAMIVNKLMKKVSSKEKVKVIVDCPSVNIKTWREYMHNLIENKDKIELSCEHKADFNHVVVSAASIVAKEKREEEVAKIKKDLGIDFGSGYPADPKTVEFLEKNFSDERYSSIIRKTWDTFKKLDKKKQQKGLNEF